ncbi:DotU family type IV/VI secretion system protein, partial [Vibrio parahaemolyticus]
EAHRRLRKQVVSVLKSHGRGVQQELSNKVEQHILAGAQVSERAPLWVVCSVTSALLVCIFMYFSYELNKASNQTFAQLVNLIQPTPAVSNPTVESKSAPIAERIS